MADPQAELKLFRPKHEFFVGIDSDGCAFDTMEVKHKFCFVTAVMQAFGLAALARTLRDVWDFVNLSSRSRGCNRWHALRATMEHLVELTPYERFKPFLAAHLDVIKDFLATSEKDKRIQLSNEGLLLYTELKLHIPAAQVLAKGIVADAVGVSTSPMGRAIVQADTSPDACLLRLLYWTHVVNGLVGLYVYDVPPFPHCRKSLEKLAPVADIICVSATPYEALAREWEEHGISRHAAVICGQEQGKKETHLALAAKGKYPPHRILMIGDAPGDLKAARLNNALFFPVNPGAEDRSWQLFLDEAANRFLSETYAGDYEAALIKEFDKHLPSTPPWKQ
ncbi:MAG TPA: HAD family hydrolase [Planctomycetota bacterium]|nr:HAD family hydrolase [Planctomycetota bacterium]